MAFITVVAPGSWIERSVANAFERLCAAHGHEVRFDPQCFTPLGQLAGSDTVRAEALGAALAAPETDVVWCGRGGYGTSRLSWLIGEVRAARPKLLIGYSDITTLLVRGTALGVRAVHGPMPIGLADPAAEPSVEAAVAGLDALLAPNPSGHMRGTPRIVGRAGGQVVVANMCTLNHLLGTPFMPDLSGRILIIEDIDEAPYQVDRMFVQFEQAGVLAKLAGLGLGSFTGLPEEKVPWHNEIAEMAADYVGKYGIPLASDLPVGHGPDNQPVVEFAEAEFLVTGTNAALKWWV